VTINNITLVVDKNSEDFSGSGFKEMFQKISSDISGHSGIAIDADKGITVARQTTLDQRQKTRSGCSKKRDGKRIK